MRYVIYCKGRRPSDDGVRHFVPIFEDIAQAKTFVTAFMGPEPMMPVINTMTWGDGFTLKCAHLDAILSAPDNGVMPDFYHRYILQFKYGIWDTPPKVKAQAEHTANDKAPSLMRERRAARPAGYVTITELASTWGIPALHARASLRASNRVRPEFGWAFDPKEVDAIKKLCMVGVPA